MLMGTMHAYKALLQTANSSQPARDIALNYRAFLCSICLRWFSCGNYIAGLLTKPRQCQAIEGVSQALQAV